MKRLILMWCLVPVMALGQAPSTTNKPVSMAPNGDYLPLSINGNPPNLPAGTTVGGGALQPFDPDLTALAALSGTNTIYYRSGANTWSPVTIGGNMTFSGGTLNSSAGFSGIITSGDPYIDFDPASGGSPTLMLFRNNEVGTADFGFVMNNYNGSNGETLKDNVLSWGYNVSITGRQNTSEHSWAERIESRYRTPGLVTQLEHYWAWISPDGTQSYRPFSHTVRLVDSFIETAVRDDRLIIGYKDYTNDWLKINSTATSGVMTLSGNSFLDFTGNLKSDGWVIEKAGAGWLGENKLFNGTSGSTTNTLAIFPNAHTDLGIQVITVGQSGRVRGLRWNGQAVTRQWESQDDSGNWKRIMLQGDGSTVGTNIFSLANPGAITFLRINADNTVSALNASDFRNAIGAGTGSAIASDVAYDATTWDANTDVPTKNAVRDKIEAMSAGGGLGTSDIDTPDELQGISGGVLYPSRTFEVTEEFFTLSTGTWLFTTGGESAPGIWDGTPEHTGVMRFTTGSGATNRSLLHDGHAAGWRFGAGAATFETVLNLTTLSDGTETYTLRFGWGDSGSGDHADGVYFRYTHSVNSGNWQLVARNNSTETVTNSSTPPVAGTWQRFTIVVNSAGTSAEFFVNGSSIGTVASNIPTAAGRETGLYFSMAKSAGTTARTMFCDYIHLRKRFTTPR